MEKPIGRPSDMMFVGILRAQKGNVFYQVYVHFYGTVNQYGCTIYNNREEVEFRLHPTQLEVIDKYQPFFGEEEIKGLRFREDEYDMP
jgi:hypothetical protein